MLSLKFRKLHYITELIYDRRFSNVGLWHVT